MVLVESWDILRLRNLEEEFPNESITVVIPEILTETRISSILHNKTALMLRNRLRQALAIIIEVSLHILLPKKKPKVEIVEVKDDVDEEEATE